MEQEKQSNRIKLVAADRLEPSGVHEPATRNDQKDTVSPIADVDATTNSAIDCPETDKVGVGISISDVTKLMTEAPSDEFVRVLEAATLDELQSLLREIPSHATKPFPASKTAPVLKLWIKVMDVPPEPRTFFSVLGWWESRRWFYNCVVGFTGLTFAALICLRFQLYGVFLVWALLVCALYAIVANVCYSLGVPAELIVRLFWKHDRFGPVLFTLGLIFSLVVVALTGIFYLYGLALPGLQG